LPAAECGLEGKTTPEALEAAWERNLLALYPTAAVLPGVERLTAHLATCGVPMAVATSSSAKALAAKRQPHGPLFARFAAFVTAEDVARGKPAPDAFLAAAAKLGVPPADCAVFEDAQSGVEAGLAAGCAVVAVPDATLHADAAPFAQAHAVLRSLDDFDPAEWGLPPYPPRQ
jgi:pseudouridine-5'-monophosphatase